MSVDFYVDQASVRSTVDYLKGKYAAVVAGIRTGMMEGMQILAAAVAPKLPHRSGELQAKVLASPKVTETQKTIRGTISSNVGRKPLGLWLEFGVKVPEVKDKLMVFTAKDGTVVFTRGHKAFQTPGIARMFPTLQERKAQIIETIQNRMAEAAQ
jgi:hypothetical protein